MNKLHEIKVWNFNWRMERHVEIMKSCYLNVLIEDDSWHFFWEGAYAVIRCSSASVKPVLDFFDGHGFETTFHDEWFDNIPITRQHQEEFEMIFHGYSVLAMTYNGETEFHNLLDRVAHCFFNMCWTPEMADREKNKFGVACQEYESMSYTYLGIRRAEVVGWIRGKSDKDPKYSPAQELEKIQNSLGFDVQ